MNNIFNKINKIFSYKFKYKKGNIGILISDRGRVDSNFRTIISASIINDLYGANTFVLTDRKNYDKLNGDLFKLYNIKKIYSSPLIFISTNLVIYIKTVLEIILFIIKIINKKNKLYWFISQYNYLNIKVGDLIYDQYIRNDLSFIKPKIFSLKFLKVFFDGIYKILIIDKNVKKHNIKLIISNQKAYTSVGNLLLRYGTKNNLITMLTGYNFIKFYTNYEESLYHPFKVSNYLLKQIKNYKQKKIEKFYYDRIASKVKVSYVDPKLIKKLYTNYKNNNFTKFIKSLKKNGYKTVNVFALHAFSDCSHAFGNLIFNDYYDQFVSTIRFLKKHEKNKNAFWLIKPHPARRTYNEENIVESILKKYNVKNVKICPSNINNNVLFNNIDNLITTASTVGLEYACTGKKPILSGLAPYYKKNLFHRITSRQGYFRMLENIHFFENKISKKDTNICKRILFVMENLVNFNLIKSSILSSDTQRHYKGFESYINLLFKNCQKLRIISLYYDEFYQDLKKKLKITLI